MTPKNGKMKKQNQKQQDHSPVACLLNHWALVATFVLCIFATKLFNLNHFPVEHLPVNSGAMHDGGQYYLGFWETAYLPLP